MVKDEDTIVTSTACWAIAVLELAIAIYIWAEWQVPDIIPDECDKWNFRSRKHEEGMDYSTKSNICQLKEYALISAIPLTLCSLFTMIGCYNEMGIGFSMIMLVLTLVLTPIVIWTYSFIKDNMNKLNNVECSHLKGEELKVCRQLSKA